MDAFSYLSVLLSIILGLAITQVLQGIRGLLLHRARVRFYWPTLVWAGLILVLATQLWWASFGLADHARWTFAAFGMVLLQTTLLYLFAALVLPDIAAGEPLDLRAHYYREARPFFLIFVAILVTSVTKDWVLDGRLPGVENLAFHLVFGALALAGAVSARQWLHEGIAIAFAALATLYIALLFSVLA